jgi:hypothetical protein
MYENFVYDGLQSYSLAEEFADVAKSKAISSAEMFGKKSTLQTTKIVEKQHEKTIIGDNMSWAITIFLMVYIFVLALSKNYIVKVVRIFLSKTNRNLVYQDLSRNFVKEANSLVLFSILVVSALLFILATDIFDVKEHKIPVLTVTILTVVCLCGFFKRLNIKIIGYLSENETLKGKIYTIETIISSLYGLAVGLFLIFNFLVEKESVSAWILIALAIIAILYIFKIFKLVLIFIDEKISSFFLILYLCAVEILPIWLIIDFL